MARATRSGPKSHRTDSLEGWASGYFVQVVRVENPSYPAHADAPLRPLEAPGRELFARVWAEERTGFVLLAVAGIALLLVVFALGDRVTHNDQVLPGVTAGGVDLSGMTESEALAAVQERGTELVSKPITVQAGTHALSVDPSALGLQVNAAATVRAAARRAGPATRSRR